MRKAEINGLQLHGHWMPCTATGYNTMYWLTSKVHVIFFYCKWSCMVVLLNSSSVLLCSSWFFALPPHLYKPCHAEVCEETVVNCFVPRKKKSQIIKWKLSHFLVKYNINYSFFFNNLVEKILHTKHNCFLNLTV